MDGTASRMASASVDLLLGGRAEAGADGHRAFERRQNCRMAVAQQQRPPGADVIDVLVAVRVEDVRSLAAGDEGRIPADAAERAHRRIHSSRNDALRALK